MNPLEVVLIKPSKYDLDGFVQRFRRGFLPNATGIFIKSMTPREVSGRPVKISWVDEYVCMPKEFMHLLRGSAYHTTLVALVGVQSHQFQRALDLAAFAVAHGCLAIIGGPHPMTCDTKALHGKGVSFALAEAERIWPTVINDAIRGELQPVYGNDQRWAERLNPPVLEPPTKDELSKYVMRMLGVYPVRGCPFRCNFCSVIKIAGRQIRSQPIETTIKTLLEAKKAGVKLIMFTSDNLNKYPEVWDLMGAIIEANLDLEFFCQCDTQIAEQEDLIEFMARAGCFQIFVGAESFDRTTLKGVHKGQNRPDTYQKIIDSCLKHGVTSHFSNIIGFPNQDSDGVRKHMDTLCALSPDVASFYILTPIPGTEQYEDFRQESLIIEPNLDRYDTTHLVWRHPHLAPDELTKLLFECYYRFYRPGYALIKKAVRRHGINPANVAASMANAAFNWMSAAQKRHPMSGGIWRRRADHVRNFLKYRQDFFGDVLVNDLVPLPDNLELPVSDALSKKTISLLTA